MVRLRLYNTVHANGKQPRREGGRRGASFLLPPIIPRVFCHADLSPSCFLLRL